MAGADRVDPDPRDRRGDDREPRQEDGDGPGDRADADPEGDTGNGSGNDARPGDEVASTPHKGGAQTPTEPIRGTPYGMLLVMVAILAVVIVFGIAMQEVVWKPESPAPMVAAMTATFAVIGTLVGSYFGVKAGLDGQYVQASAHAARDTDLKEERKRWDQLRDDREQIKRQDEKIRRLENELQRGSDDRDPPRGGGTGSGGGNRGGGRNT